MKANSLRRLIYAALFLAIALTLPFLTGQIPEIGKMLCPMHLPVLATGFLLGMPYGAVVGFVAPLLRCLLFSTPVFTTALPMAFELLAYGLLAGLFCRLLPKRLPFYYLALLLSLLGGRITLAVAQLLMYGIRGESFVFTAYFSANVTRALPGIALQFLLLPPLVHLLSQKKGLRAGREKKEKGNENV